MVTLRVIVRTGVGLHARPAALVVQETLKHRCQVVLEHGGKKADARSITQVLALGVEEGGELTIRADGENEQQVALALSRLLSGPVAPSAGGR